ncbi:Zn-dependent peptidase ImmA (M78 family)/transcriptional regulator with XRE-family HTH domain [Pelomonas saccharophila]|uniref:Zn-dependent peptidase ImmA (M78 family)/transcriptional regulator with XRE-family HTH domain n=1 Tax=Roseateles saccharophilus TaxID=304 RepID=A0ABU1YPL1_ROSSA|nr:XRE family transcriptional regulator [Roseateles saccharophilus]MDR7270673.1 Zn-dependent peptidase ImmA (M78 family)/transcriptional regulator with XRE-family HTH domain [Roseateles saccharophilus]
MTTNINPSELDLVFGADTSGDSPESRARTSSARFVRSQIQLAPYSQGATGRILSARESLRTFGWHALKQAVIEGSAPLVSSSKEPAATIRSRREELGLSIKQLADRAHITADELEKIETPGTKTSFRTLEFLAQALALNEQVLGLVPNAGRDSNLGVRLREMATAKDIHGFTGATVLQLSEAAWVVARQAALQDILQGTLAVRRVRLPRHDPSFGYPAWEIGYSLARKTRQLLGLTEDEPIDSVRKVIEDDFGLPLIQLRMDQRFAGATMANGGARGIVINETGMNSNVWVRRMTMCHELGHLLWDPDAQLQRVTVDAYADLEMSDRDARRDPPEIRANAFAVAFLAPPSAVQTIAKKHSDPLTIVAEVMETFGISATAAKHHVRNVAKRDAFGGWQDNLPEPEDHWIAMENLTLDFFPIDKVPLSRRGKFAWCVAKSSQIGEITTDSAASWLAVRPGDVTEEALKAICTLREDS